MVKVLSKEEELKGVNVLLLPLVKSSSRSQFFPKDSRLLSKEDYSFVREGAKLSSTSLIRIFYKPTRLNSSKTRLGMSISKKVGRANVRNKVKRILREEFRRSDFRELGLDCHLIVNGKSFNSIEYSMRYKTLKEHFNRCFKRLA